ncbi:DUF58 domain-containing protein [Microbacterium fluvii]|uniref:DUF58 domain-containing protein n=1 Tax=Microbacterium fluvii TaxID=415215 RepID=A0ABW2HF01_9MICO|nr:DUF58 domain-containing protein [Microbacterium fluvii]MCU4671680.1 DUF58 domain-containing protein [Microbacterium fluvii]
MTARGTGALALAVGCFVAANELGIPALMYFGLLLPAAVAAALISLHLARHSEQVERTLRPETATVGERVRVSLGVSMRSSLPTAPGSWSDRLSSGFAGDAHGAFPALRSGLRAGEQEVTLEYSAVGIRRGVHVLGPLSVRTTDPFGLARRDSTLGATTAVSVAPAVIDLPTLSEFSGESGGALHSVNSRLGQGADNLIARHYVPGDSMRRIHWRASAHRDALMVRQEEQESTPDATVVLDRSLVRWQASALLEPGADPSFEHAVSLCVSVALRLVSDGYSVEVLDTDGAPLAERIDAGDLGEVEELIRRCATLTAHRDDRLAALAPRYAGDTTGPLVLIVGRLTPADVPALGGLAHHTALPVLLAIAPVDDALARAASIGWHTAATADADDAVDAWVGAVARGVSRVG